MRGPGISLRVRLEGLHRTGKICGIALPSGMRESERLPEPIFTPATKSMSGEHDENISFDQMVARVGGDNAEELRRLSLAIYAKAADHALQRGLILADTKFEFGMTAKGIVLADEVLTPDSSRFWPSEGYHPGAPQPSFDKQFVRDYLESIGWNKQPPAPELPGNVVRQTQEKYEQALYLLTGPELKKFALPGPSFRKHTDEPGRPVDHCRAGSFRGFCFCQRVFCRGLLAGGCDSRALFRRGQLRAFAPWVLRLVQNREAAT
jgi:hypothetical protein